MIQTKENTLWVEKYRPDTLDGYVGNEHIIEKVKIYIENEDVPHLLLYGQAGTGKTTLAKIITNQIDCDVMYVNASDENSVDAVRDKIRGFASSMGFRKWKVIILDESDYLTPNAQAALRNLMETFSKTTRFILTCNYVEKIIDPIQSRCQTFSITPPSKKEVAIRLADILKTENVEYVMGDIAVLVNSGYPDIRRVLNAAQRQVVGGVMKIDKTSTIQANYMDDVKIELMSKDDVKTSFTNIRQIIADSKVKDFTPFYRFLYDEVDTYGGSRVGNTILTIAEAQYKDASVVDKEINVMSMLLQILVDIKG
jgi:replication factor C small subunit|tara:strand:- start:867 stop:1799 length:933 start_codon:yes stop_codon:yes gene_type:complete